MRPGVYMYFTYFFPIRRTVRLCAVCESGGICGHTIPGFEYDYCINVCMHCAVSDGTI